MRIKSKLWDYDVRYLGDIESLVKDISNNNNDLAWIIDDNVYTNYYNLFQNIPVCEPVTHIHCDESTKSFENIYNILNHFFRMKVKSSTTIIAVGGGTLQDAVGFACSIFHRGIQWKFVPTTLLSMADSCIGGKTSLNYRNKKNVFGTFYPPNEILICENWLETLPNEYYISGMGEIIKFYILNNDIHLFSLDKNDIFGHIVYSLEYKKNIINIDEFDKKERKYLNYGHTFGHALESISDYSIPHGIAIMIGILIVNRYTNKLGYLDKIRENEIFNIITNTLHFVDKEYIHRKDWFDFDKLLEIIKHDKKYTNSVNLVIIKNNSPSLHLVEDFISLKQSLLEIYQELNECS